MECHLRLPTICTVRPFPTTTLSSPYFSGFVDAATRVRQQLATFVGIDCTLTSSDPGTCSEAEDARKKKAQQAEEKRQREAAAEEAAAARAAAAEREKVAEVSSQDVMCKAQEALVGHHL